MIVGTAELDVIARTAGFEPSLRSQIEGDTAGLAAVAEAEAGKVEKATGGAAAGMAGIGGAARTAAKESEEAGGRVAAAMEQAGERAERSTEPLTESFKAMLGPLGNLRVGGPAALAGIGAVAVDLGSKFQEATTQISVSGDMTQKQADAIGAAFLKTAGTSTFSGQQMAEAYAPVAGQLNQLNGGLLTTTQALNFQVAAADLAEASNSDLTTTTASLASVMQAYHMNVGQAADATDVLFNTARLTNTPVSDLGQAIGRLHARLGEASPSLKDTGALVDVLAQQGLKGSRGILTVSTAMTTLLGGSKATNDQLKAMGVSVFDSSGKFVGMQSVIAQLQPKLAAMTDAQRFAAEKTLFGASAAQIMGQVIEGGVPAYEHAADAIAKTGSAHEGAEAKAKTFEGSMKTAKAAVIDMATQLGTALLPWVAKVATAIGHATSFLTSHRAILEALGILIGGALVAALGVFAVNMTTKMIGSFHKAGDSLKTLLTKLGILQGEQKATAVSTEVMAAAQGEAALAADGLAVSEGAADAAALPLIATIGLIVAAVAAVAFGIYELVKHWKTVWGAIKDVARAVWNDGIKPVFHALEAGAKAIGEVFATAWHGIDTVIHFVGAHITQIVKAILLVALGPLGIAIDLLWTHWKAVWGAIETVLSAAWNGVIRPVFGFIKTAGIDVLHAGLTALETVWRATWGAITAVLNVAWNNVLKPVFGLIKTLGIDFIKIHVEALKLAWTVAWDGIKAALKLAWTVLRPVFNAIKTLGLDLIHDGVTALKTVWDAAWGAFHTAVEAMWRIVRPILETIKKLVDGIGKTVGLVGKGLGGLGHLAKGGLGLVGKGLSLIGLAEGGIVTKPTLAMVAEAGHPEAILPLGNPSRVAEILADIAERGGFGASVMGGTTSTAGLYRAGMTSAHIPTSASASNGGGGDNITVGPIYTMEARLAADEAVRKLRARQWAKAR